MSTSPNLKRDHSRCSAQVSPKPLATCFEAKELLLDREVRSPQPCTTMISMAAI